MGGTCIATGCARKQFVADAGHCGLRIRYWKTHKMHKVDLVLLYALEQSGKLKLGQYKRLITTVHGRQRDEDEAVDVRHGQQPHLGLRLDTVGPPARLLVPPNLHHVGDAVAMRNHYGFLYLVISEKS